MKKKLSKSLLLVHFEWKQTFIGLGEKCFIGPCLGGAEEGIGSLSLTSSPHVSNAREEEDDIII